MFSNLWHWTEKVQELRLKRLSTVSIQNITIWIHLLYFIIVTLMFSHIHIIYFYTHSDISCWLGSAQTEIVCVPFNKRTPAPYPREMPSCSTGYHLLYSDICGKVNIILQWRRAQLLWMPLVFLLHLHWSMWCKE